jgi:hypothetical protein
MSLQRGARVLVSPTVSPEKELLLWTSNSLIYGAIPGSQRLGGHYRTMPYPGGCVMTFITTVMTKQSKSALL